MVAKAKYRKGMLTGKRPLLLAKGEYHKAEHLDAAQIDAKFKNADFGFSCLHYSVSEASESLSVAVLNKRGVACSVRVRTIDAEAKAGSDYEAVDEEVHFAKGEATKYVKVVIIDDDNW